MFLSSQILKRQKGGKVAIKKAITIDLVLIFTIIIPTVLIMAVSAVSASVSSSAAATLIAPVNWSDFNASSDAFVFDVNLTGTDLNCSLHGNWTAWSTDLNTTLHNFSDGSLNITGVPISGFSNGTVLSWGVKCVNSSDASDYIWSSVNETFKILKAVPQLNLNLVSPYDSAVTNQGSFNLTYNVTTTSIENIVINCSTIVNSSVEGSDILILNQSAGETVVTTVSGYSNGTFAWHAVCENQTLGSYGDTSSWSLIVDDEDPVINVTGDSPVWVNAPYSLTINITDATNMSSVVVNFSVQETYTTTSKSFAVQLNATGNQTVTVTAYDEVSNFGSTTVWTLLDLNLPVSNVVGVSDGAGMTSAFNFTVNGSDTGSGISYVNYTLVNQDGTYNITEQGSSGFVVSVPGNEEGNYSLSYFSADAAGNIESVNNLWFTLDTEAPGIVVSGAQHSWQTSVYDLTINVSDTIGISNVTVNFSGQENYFTSSATDFTISVNATGNQTVTVTAYDNGGNYNTSTVWTLLDVNLPQTEILGISYGEGRSSGFTITLNSTDIGSGIAYTNFTINNQDTSYNITNQSTGLMGITVPSSDGNYTLEYYSVDNAGNNEALNSIWFTIDAQPPSITYGGAQDTWVSSVYNITINVTDTFGVAWVYVNFSLQDDYNSTDADLTISINATGNQTVTVTAADNAGNMDSATFTTALDMTGPTCNMIGVSEGDVYYQSKTVQITGYDGESGLDYVVMNVTGDLVGTFNGSSSVSHYFNETGNYSIAYYGVDDAGSIGNVSSFWFGVDFDVPTTSINFSSTTWVQADYVIIGYNCTDNGPAGCSATYYCKSTDYKTSCTSPLSPVLWNGSLNITYQGTSYLIYRSIDNVGQPESYVTQVVKLDSGAPVTYSDVSPGWKSHVVGFTLTSADSVSGVNYTSYAIDSVWYNGTYNTVNSSGNHTLQYFSVDNAGNVETTHTEQILIDLDMPTTPVMDLLSNYTKNTSVLVGWSASSDALSGVDYYKVQFSLDSNFTSGLVNATVQSGRNYTFTGLSEGQAFFRVRAYDSVGNAGNWSSPVNITIDLTAPASVTNPLLNISYSNSTSHWMIVLFNWSVTDANGVDSVSISVDSAAYQSVSVNGSTTFNFTAGKHIVRLRANDTSGNIFIRNISYQMDMPMNLTKAIDDLEAKLDLLADVSISIVRSDNSSFDLSGDNVSVNHTFDMVIDINDTIPVLLRLDDFSGLDVIWENNITFITNISDDPETNETVVDLGSTPQAIFTISNMDDFLPGDDSYTASVSFNISSLTYHYVYYCDGNCSRVVNNCSSADPSAGELPCNFYNGTNNSILTVFIPHFSGVVLSLDNIVGDITVTAPDNNTNGGDLSFDFTASEEIMIKNMTINGTAVAQFPTSAGTSFSIDIDGTLSDGVFTDGDHVIVLDVNDSYGNNDTITYVFNVADTSKPDVQISPATGSYSGTSDTYNRVVSLSSDEYGNYSYIFNGGASVSGDLDSGKGASIVVALAEGQNNLTIYVSDRHGNTDVVYGLYDYTKTVVSDDSGSSGSSGGGSSGRTYTPPISETTDECIPNYSCTSWTACSDEKQTRVCVDLNDCGNTSMKPIETRDCISASSSSSQDDMIQDVPLNPDDRLTGKIVSDDIFDADEGLSHDNTPTDEKNRKKGSIFYLIASVVLLIVGMYIALRQNSSRY